MTVSNTNNNSLMAIKTFEEYLGLVIQHVAHVKQCLKCIVNFGAGDEHLRARMEQLH